MDSQINYQGLDVAEDQIRLIELYPRAANTPATLNDTLRCELSPHHRGDTCPPYLALSYAWQHDGRSQSVIINNKTCQVSETVEQALRQLRHRRNTVYVWVDQICINQDDKEEKNYQVQQMRHTYSEAEGVIAWLGMPFPNSKILFGFLQQIGAAVLKAKWKALTTALDAVDLASMKVAYRSFCQRPYWKRLWIIQEFSVASRVRIVCGSSSIDVKSMDAAFMVEGLFEERSWGSIPGSNTILNNIKDIYNPAEASFVNNVITRRQRYDPGSLGANGKKDHLFRVLATCLVLEVDYNWPLASDPRDRVFSLFYLASDFEVFGASFIDYLKSPEQVYCDTTVALLNQGHVDIFSYCQFPKALSLPSWVVDWNTQVRNPCVGAPWCKFNASGAASSAVVSQPQPGYLTVLGTSVDTITAFGDIWDPDWLKPLDRNAALTFVNNILELCKRSPRTRLNEEMLDAIRIAAVDGVGCYGLDIEENYGVYLGQFMDAFEGLKDAEENQDGDEEDKRDNWYEAVLLALHSRRPFITSTGFVGLCPSHVAVGDVVCIFYGGKAPYVIRPGKYETFTFIGEAYVQGIMYGEFLKAKPASQTFTLV
ncbi:heterokaryon incompatibility protein-domain-containing protein [Ilyonectria destructans]|nr:heterokaryon incompatibility protein-domain-containing protein [Ilyonectria destructans]